jgi:hypothetical protein
MMRARKLGSCFTAQINQKLVIQAFVINIFFNTFFIDGNFCSGHFLGKSRKLNHYKYDDDHHDSPFCWFLVNKMFIGHIPLLRRRDLLRWKHFFCGPFWKPQAFLKRWSVLLFVWLLSCKLLLLYHNRNSLESGFSYHSISLNNSTQSVPLAGSYAYIIQKLRFRNPTMKWCNFTWNSKVLWGQRSGNIFTREYTQYTNFDGTCPADMPGRHTRQTCPADMPGRHARQTCPADMPGRHARQTCPADLPGRLVRQTCYDREVQSCYDRVVLLWQGRLVSLDCGSLQ